MDYACGLLGEGFTVPNLKGVKSCFRIQIKTSSSNIYSLERMEHMVGETSWLLWVGPAWHGVISVYSAFKHKISLCQ